MDIYTVVLRFSIVFFLSLIFGLERQKSHKPTGFGTFIFVAVGSCALSLLAMSIEGTNPLPLLGAVVTGIGFLGAGALVRTSDKIFGMTTAASIWTFAIFGMIIGVGKYLEGAIIYGLVWIIILIDSYLERKGIGLYQRKLILTTNKILNTKDIDKVLPNNKILHVERNKDSKKMVISYLIEGSKEEMNVIPKTLYNQEWFENCKLE